MPVQANSKIRINTFLALAGLGSRRSVERLILNGEIQVNGRIIRDLGVLVDLQKDTVLFRGKRLSSLELRYIMLNKPRGYACTRWDPHMEKTIYDLLPSNLRHLAYAGRLDIDSEGLLLLSNDGKWVERLAHPRHAIPKTYEAEVEGSPTQESLDQMCRGIRSRSEWLKAESVEILAKTARKTALRLVLREGKNREIRRLLGALHHPVLQLKRVAVGLLALGNLPSGEWRELSPEEVRRLRDEEHSVLGSDDF